MILGFDWQEALLRQEPRQQASDLGFVINDQNRLHVSSATLIWLVNREPDALVKAAAVIAPPLMQHPGSSNKQSPADPQRLCTPNLVFGGLIVP